MLANLIPVLGPTSRAERSPEPCRSVRECPPWRWLCVTSSRVKLHVPEALEAHDVLEPQQRRAHGLEVGGDVIDAREAEAVRPAARRGVVSIQAGEQGAGSSWRSTKRKVVSPKGVVMEKVLVPALVALGLNLADRVPARAIERGRRSLDVLHLERQRADSVGVAAE